MTTFTSSILSSAVSPVAKSLVNSALTATLAADPIESAKDRKNRLARERRAAKKFTK